MEHSEPHELVFCHECENEWYKEQYGLTCPECQSDFTEIIEQGQDPAQDDDDASEGTEELEAPSHPPHGEFYAPDPEESDISNLNGLQWEQTGPGRYRVRGTVNQTITPGRPQQGGLPEGFMGLIGGMLENMVQQRLPPQQGQQPRASSPTDRRSSAPASSSPAPGSPPAQEQPGSGNFVRHGGGNGFSWTIASSSNTTFAGGPATLFPRDAGGPQPFQQQPEQINTILQRMMANIGAMPGGPHDAFGPFAGGQFGHDPFAPMDGPRGGPGMGPFGGIFDLLAPPGGRMGDAVYSQEALDRVISQLMEQHQSGNAPGPASAAAIASLPKKEITEKDLGDNGRAECSICMDEVPLGSMVTALPCAHWFHPDCIKVWLGEHDTCPHCRRGIMPKEGAGPDSSRAREASQTPQHDMNSPEYTRPVVPGAFPSPPQQDTSDRPGTGGGVFSRMREAFGRSPPQNDSDSGATGGSGESRT